MTRVLRDSTTPAAIPLHGCDLVAAYWNGRYAWSAADRERFTAAGIRVVNIDVIGTAAGSCGVLDVEAGDATIPTAVEWAAERHRAHPGAYPPIIYCSRSVIAPLAAAMTARGLHLGAGYRLWVATLDGTRVLADMTGVTAVQYAGVTQTGGHYDESVVYDDAWCAPSPPPPAPLDGVTVWLDRGQLHSRGVVSADAGKTWR